MTKAAKTSSTARTTRKATPKATKTAIGLLDIVRTKLGVSTDSALASALEVAPPAISKIRNMHTKVSAELIIKIHDATKMTLDEIRAYLPGPAKAKAK